MKKILLAVLLTALFLAPFSALAADSAAAEETNAAFTVDETKALQGMGRSLLQGYAESLRGDNTRLSRDYPGVLCDLVTERSGDRALFLPGPVGGLVMTREFFDPFDAEYDVVFHLYGEQKMPAYWGISQIKAKMVWVRPFDDITDMDLSMISNWNKTVHSQDTVYHLGDFGEPYALSLLNFGKMLFVNGNYENKKKVDMEPAFEEDGRVEVIPSGSICTLDGFDYKLCHEPCPEGECGDDGNFWLYGHIHSSQRIKRNGINVGADCNGYWPVPATEIERLRMQVRNFADDNCFCEWVNGREGNP